VTKLKHLFRKEELKVCYWFTNYSIMVFLEDTKFFTWSPLTMHPKIPHRFYKRTILRPLNLAQVFTVHFIQIYLTITFLSTTTSSKLSPLMMLFQTHSSTYFLVFRSFCLSCPFHNSHFIHLKYKKLKVIELDYVAPPRPNKNVWNLSWKKKGGNQVWAAVTAVMKTSPSFHMR
jgi:hypothetical protein